MRHVVSFWCAVKHSLLHTNVRTYVSICNVLACTRYQVSLAVTCSAAALESGLRVLMATTTSKCECVLPVSCKCESRRWRDVFKDHGHRIDDLLEGTKLQDPAKNYNFGIFTVRQGMGKKNADEYYQLLDQDFEFLCKKDRDAKGPNRKRKAVAITKGSTPEYTGYETFQCTAHNCSCKYTYAKTGDHDHYNTEELVAPSRFVDTLNFLGQKRQCIVDEVVANCYSPSQRVPPHTDYAPIYARCTSIVSASFGNAGIFVWKVRAPKAELDEAVPSFANQHPLWSALGGPKKRGDAGRQEMIKTLGYAGAVALFHGDVLVMEGTFQTHFEHATLVIDKEDSLEDLLARYPATTEQSQQLIATALSQKQVFEKRLNLTARLISNHKPRCGNHIGKAPIGHQPNALTVDIMPRAPAPPRHPANTQVALRSYRPCQRSPPAPTILTAPR